MRGVGGRRERLTKNLASEDNNIIIMVIEEIVRLRSLVRHRRRVSQPGP